jgi:RND superfamily putative drug exporter
VPLAIGGISIVGAFTLLRAMSELVDTSLFALNLATALSLGLAVDYALLLISRYREELDAHGPTREAHLRTVTTAGRTVLFSGLTVAAALSALILMPQRFLYSIGAAGAGVALLSAIVALLVVPSVLALAGDRINALSIRRGPAVSDSSDGWYRLARWVMRRPVAVALTSMALLLGAASPLLDTELTGPSAQAVPPGLSAYEANEYVETHYPRGVSEPITVTVAGRTTRRELAAYRAEILRTETITGGSQFTGAGADVAFATFASDRAALEPEPQDAVREIRDLPGPGASETLVSGNTAGFLDQKKSFAENGPLVVGLIAGVTLVLLFLLTGSVVLPLKALLMNVLTLGATLGILVFGFQQGNLDSLFDYTGPGAIEVVSLIFLFAVTFGLATDYAVLVLARIKEHYDGGASNEEAVALGIARTGRVITAAALMIAVVFLAFAVSPVFFMKQIAVGAALGVLIDATIVRALLVPSLMRLMGAWNWWAPKPLRWLHWRFGIRES